ncbi:hypothetical protein [Phaeobacter sp.]|uniref:hypothetical protein n=1 Tax=Phaeobacter sp. TaxID=1902409 RepID=UPI0025FBB6D5|nr:hypothetical protein [Phaeobacter sp.]
MFKRLVSTSLVFGMLATAPPAHASGCIQRDTLVERLETSYAERLTAGGFQQSRPVSTVVELWASEATGTFTIVVSHPNGLSCIVASGTDFFQLEPAPKDPGTPS